MRRSVLFIVVSLALFPAACRRSQQPTEPLRVVPQISPVEPRRVSFSPADEGRLLVMESSGLVGLWDIDPAEKPQLFATIRGYTIDAAFSPDGRFVATVGLDGRLRWWRADGRLEWVSGVGHKGPARAVAVASDFIATGGEDGTIRLWGRDGSALGEPLSAHERSLVSIAASPRGDLVSVGAEDTVRFWKRVRNEPGPTSQVGFESNILHRADNPPYADQFVRLAWYDTSWGWDRSVAFSPGGDAFAVTLLDHSLHIWNTDGTSRAVVRDAHLRRPVRGVSFSPAGDRLATAGFDGRVRLWNLDGSPYGEPIEAHYGMVFSVAFSPSGNRLATAGRDDTVRIWNPNGTLAFEFPRGHKDRVSTVAFASDEPVFAVAHKGGGVRTWAFDGDPRSTLLKGQKEVIGALAFSPKSDLLAAGRNDGTVWLWQGNGKQVGRSFAAGPKLATLAFAPRDDILAVGAAAFQLWKEGRRLWRQPLGSVDRVVSIAFSPEGDFIVTGSFLGRVQVWNPDGSAQTEALKQKWENIVAVAVPPSGDSFAAVVGGSKPEITLFNLDGSPRGAPLEGHLAATSALAYTPDGRLVSGSKDGTVRFWTLPSGPVESIDVGLPVDQLGFWRDLLWVRAGGEYLFFYDGGGKLIATVVLRRESVLAYTPGGWYSGPVRADRYVRLFTESGEAVPPADALRRMSPSRVLQSITNRK
jgi:WD40 repeat protein